MSPFPSSIVTYFSVRPSYTPLRVAAMPILYSVLVGTVIDFIIGGLKSYSAVYILIISSKFLVKA